MDQRPSGPRTSLASATIELLEDEAGDEERSEEKPGFLKKPGFWGASSTPGSADTWPVEFSVRCKDGEARIEDAVHLRWRTGGRERIDSLSTERTAVSVAIDHFARRLAGGLIPVPDLGDLLEADRLVGLAQQSLATAEAEPVDGDE